MKSLVVANQKGGVGKTALIAHLAFDFAERGLRVLAIDFDTQGNASYTLRAQTVIGVASQLFAATVPKVVGKPGISLFRADSALANLDSQELQGAALCLRNNLRSLQDKFDVCLIDTAPALGVRLVAALVSADFVLSPIELEAYSIQGIRMMVSTIANVRKTNPALKFLGILPSKVDSRNPRHIAHLAELEGAYRAQLIPMPIGLRSSVADALAIGQPVWTIRKTAARKAAQEMRNVAAHLCHAMNLTPAKATKP
jgi:chromosome partitioning protein